MNQAPHIQLLSIGDGLQPGCYTFHAGFPRIDNFINTKGDLIALGNDLSLQAPNTIIINEFASGSYRQINIQNDSIAFDQFIITRWETPIYHSHFQYPNCSFFEIKQRVEAFIESHHTLFPAGSLLQMILKNKLPPETSAAKPSPADSPIDLPTDLLTDLPTGSPSAFDEALHHAFAKAFSLFEEDFFDSISRFRGRGHGLTPAGDDFIAGVLYGIHCLEAIENKNLASIKSRVFDIAAGQNPFSNTLLNMALEGRCFKRLKDFLHALLLGDNKDVKNTFRQLISTGHTSGADLPAGFFNVFLHKPVSLLRKVKKYDHVTKTPRH